MIRRIGVIVAAALAIVLGYVEDLAQARGEFRREVPRWWYRAALCVHRGEGAWNSHTGNGYFGGLQMDLRFQRTYGAWMLRHYGTADHWSPKAQLVVAHRGWLRQGWGAWPATSRRCGLR